MHTVDNMWRQLLNSKAENYKFLFYKLLRQILRFTSSLISQSEMNFHICWSRLYSSKFRESPVEVCKSKTVLHIMHHISTP